MEVFQFEQEEEKEEELEENEVILAVRELRDRDGDILMKDEIPYDNSWKEISQEGVLLILGLFNFFFLSMCSPTFY